MITRRGFLKGSGVMVATFALGLPHGRAQVNAGRPPVSFAKNRKLDGWIAVDGDGAVTVAIRGAKRLSRARGECIRTRDARGRGSKALQR